MVTHQSNPHPAKTRACRQTSVTHRGRCGFSIRQDHGKKGEVYGFDGGKKVKGRKRHIIVDSLGQMLKVIVTEANGSDRVGAAYGLLEWRDQYPEMVENVHTVLADAGYRGDRFRLWVWSLVQAAVEIRENLKGEFEVVAKRWVVERTFGWLNFYRRLSKDYELLPEVSESAIYAVMVHLTLRYLAPA